MIEALSAFQAMTDHQHRPFLSGVIEGFYGPPWAGHQRLEMLEWMQAAGLNAYVYGPKDDLHHRTFWRSPYGGEDAEALATLIRACGERGIEFLYALGPGLDVRYNALEDEHALRARLAQLSAMGCRSFCLLYDDIPDQMRPEELERWGSLASAQSALTNRLFHWAREADSGVRFFFCPTPYCGRMEVAGHGGQGYLETVGRELDPAIEVFWTGPEIISWEISLEQLGEITAKLRRPPVLWDNLHANDYDGRRMFLGPYSGRPPELRGRVRGILTNPNTEMPVNFMAVRTLGEYLRAGAAWEPRPAYLAALEEWLPRFETVHRPMPLADLVLFADCHYLPQTEGPEADGLRARVASLLATPPRQWGAEAEVVRGEIRRLRDICARMAELKDRELFHAMHRRVWELREEMDLLDRFVTHHLMHPEGGPEFRSDFHLLQTYRGGFVPSLQRMLTLREDGVIEPAVPMQEGGR